MRRSLLFVTAFFFLLSATSCKALARKLAGHSNNVATYDTPSYTAPTPISEDDPGSALDPKPSAKGTSVFGGTIEKSADWFKYTPETPAVFTVLLPSSPKESTQSIPSALGSFPQYQAIATHGEGAVYIVAWMDMPEGSTLDSKAILDGARDGAVSNVATGKLRSEKPIRIAGKYPGRELVIDVSSPMTMVMTGHMFLVGRRFYQQQVVVPLSGNEHAPTERFFSSLKLLP